jgi:ankyrin repeat protein
VTAASVINELTEESNSIVAHRVRPLVLYFFSDSKETAKSDPLNLLSCLMRQILHYRVAYGKRIKHATSSATDSFLIALGKTMDIMRELFSRIPKVYIILDALDECSGAKGELLTRIFQAAKLSSSCVKVLVTTRIHPGTELDRAFQNPSYGKLIVKMSLVESQVKLDIDKFLLQKIEATPGLRALGNELRQKVKITIAQHAAGVFLWASMAWEMFCGQAVSGWTLEIVNKGLAMLGDLCNRTTAISREAEIKSSRPQSPLYGFYTAILDRVAGAQREDTKRLFQFIIFAHTPLTLRQLGAACAVRVGDKDLKSIEERMCFALADEVKTRCYPSVQIVGADQTIKVVHSSIKEYFLDGGSGEYCFTDDHHRAHLDISLTCLTYLTFTDFAKDHSTNPNSTLVEEEVLQTMGAHPFIKYSATHWSDHAKLVRDHPQIWSLFLRWHESPGGSMETSFRIYWRTRGKGTFPRKTTPMHMLYYMGLENLIELATGERRASVKWASEIYPDSVGRTPLHWAAANGHERIVASFLQKHSDLQGNFCTPEVSKSSPLALAVDYGHMGIVEMLLKNSKGQKEHIQLLELASSGGHLELVKLIFSLGVDINIKVGDFGSALHAAAYGDHIEIVRWLVKQGAKVNENHGKHGTPLQTAAFEGNPTIVAFLLEHGADVNSTGGCHGSPLQAAAYRNWMQIATTLIEYGAKVNAAGGDHGSPLGAAMYSGHTDMIKLLKAKGARPTDNTTLRKPSILDQATVSAIAQIGGEFQKGKMEVVEKRVEKVAKEFFVAIASGNERTLRVLLQIGLRTFKVALKLQGADALLLLIVRTALMILEDVVANEFSAGVDIITRQYRDALYYALDQGRTSLVETLLFDCSNAFRTYLEAGEDEKAKNINIGGMELLFTVVRAGRRDVIEMIARQWVGIIQALMGEQHEAKFIGIIKGFAEKWVIAASERNTGIVLTYGRAAMEELLAAVSTGKKQFANRLSNVCSEAVQKVFDSKESDVWLVNLFKEQISELQLSQCDDKELSRICAFSIEFLFATERVGRSRRNCQIAQKKCLEITVPILKDLEHRGLLDTLENTTRTALQDKLSDCVDATQVKHVQRDISRVLSAIMKLHSPAIKDSLSRITQHIEECTKDIIRTRWGE